MVQKPPATFMLRLQVASGDLEALSLFPETFGGRVFQMPAPWARIPIYRWQKSGSEALRVLISLAPFLVAKRAQAEAVLSSGVSFPPIGRQGLPADEAARRKALRETLSKLKTKHRIAEGCTSRAEAIKAIAIAYKQDHEAAYAARTGKERQA